MIRKIILILVLIPYLTSCQVTPPQPAGLRVMAIESFLANMAQEVAGDRIQVDTLIPLGVDPHSFEITPADVAKIATTDLLIINGAGFEEWLTETYKNSGSNAIILEASSGLAPRNPTETNPASIHGDVDPHFWLDPLLAIKYIENIRDGFIQVDPDGKQIFTQNADAYIQQLNELDTWIRTEVEKIPTTRRLMITNHESFGYYADAYGFTVIGSIIPSVTTDSITTARDLALLVESIRSTGAPAIFLEAGSTPQLAEQLAAETGIAVVSDLYTHSLSIPGGDAPSYIAMMKWNTKRIVEALQ